MKFHLKLIITAFNKFIFIEKPKCTGFSHRIMIINIQAIYNMFAESKFFYLTSHVKAYSKEQMSAGSFSNFYEYKQRCENKFPVSFYFLGAMIPSSWVWKKK